MTAGTKVVGADEFSVEIELLVRDLERGLAITPLSDEFRKLRADAPATIFVACTDERISVAALKSIVGKGGFRAVKADLHKLMFNLAPPRHCEPRHGKGSCNQVIWVHSASRALRSRKKFFKALRTSGSGALLIIGGEKADENLEIVASELSRFFSQVVAIDWNASTLVNPVAVKKSHTLLRLPTPVELPRGEFLCALLTHLLQSPHVRVLRRQEEVNRFLKCVMERLRSELIFLDLHLASVTKRLDNHQLIRTGSGRIEWIEQIRRRLDRESRRILDHIDDRRDLVLQPLSPLMVKFRQCIRSLSSRDLIINKIPGGFSCLVSPEYVNVITDLVHSDLKQSVEEDVEYYNSELSRLILDINARIQHLNGHDLQLTPVFSPFRDLWGRTENLVAFVGEGTTFTIKRRGFFDLLTAGRQKVFVIVMMAALLGRFGLAGAQIGQSTTMNWFFGVLLLIVFASGSISGWQIWRSDQEEVKRREIEQMRKKLHDDATLVSRNVLEKSGRMMRESLKRQEEQWKESELGSIEAAFRRKCQIESEAFNQQLSIRLSNLQDRHQVVNVVLSRFEDIRAVSEASLVQARNSLLESCTACATPHSGNSKRSAPKESGPAMGDFDGDDGQEPYPLHQPQDADSVEDSPTTLTARRELRRSKWKGGAT